MARIGAVKLSIAEEKRVASVAAQSNLVATQEALKKTAIRSPTNGIVGHLTNIKPGKYLKGAAKMTLFTSLTIKTSQSNCKFQHFKRSRSNSINKSKCMTRQTVTSLEQGK